MSDDSSSSIEDLDLNNLPSKSAMKYQVSGWDDDDEGVNEEKFPHETPEKELLWAAENGNVDLVSKNIRLRLCPINIRDGDGYTPLHRACYNDHVEIAEILLTEGARTDSTTIDGWQPLHSACRWNSVKCAQLLIQHGADINAKTNGGITPLHLAAGIAEAKELIIMLLAHPLLVQHAVDASGDRPVDIARRSGPLYGMFEAFEPCFL